MLMSLFSVLRTSCRVSPFKIKFQLWSCCSLSRLGLECERDRCWMKSVSLKRSVGCASHFTERELCRLAVNNQLWWYTCVTPELSWEVAAREGGLGWLYSEALCLGKTWAGEATQLLKWSLMSALRPERWQSCRPALLGALFSKRLLEVQESGSGQTGFRSGLEFYGN